MDYKNENDEIEIDLRGVIRALLDKFWIICLAVIIAAVSAFLFSKFILTPKYSSETQIYVLNRQNEMNVTYNDLQMANQLTKDYKVLITSRTVLEQVITELDLDMTPAGLEAITEVSAPTDTRVITISVEHPDPVMAMNIANAIRNAAAAHIKEVMDIEAVNVVTTANLPLIPSSPSVKKYTLVGAVLGMLIAAGIITMRFILDDTIKTPEDVERYLGLSTLASIPISEEEMKKKKKKKKSRTKADDGGYGENGARNGHGSGNGNENRNGNGNRNGNYDNFGGYETQKAAANSKSSREILDEINKEIINRNQKNKSKSISSRLGGLDSMQGGGK